MTGLVQACQLETLSTQARKDQSQWRTLFANTAVKTSEPLPNLTRSSLHKSASQARSIKRRALPDKALRLGKPSKSLLNQFRRRRLIRVSSFDFTCLPAPPTRRVTVSQLNTYLAYTERVIFRP